MSQDSLNDIQIIFDEFSNEMDLMVTQAVEDSSHEAESSVMDQETSSFTVNISSELDEDSSKLQSDLATETNRIASELYPTIEIALTDEDASIPHIDKTDCIPIILKTLKKIDSASRNGKDDRDLNSGHSISLSDFDEDQDQDIPSKEITSSSLFPSFSLNLDTFQSTVKLEDYRLDNVNETIPINSAADLDRDSFKPAKPEDSPPDIPTIRTWSGFFGQASELSKSIVSTIPGVIASAAINLTNISAMTTEITSRPIKESEINENDQTNVIPALATSKESLQQQSVNKSTQMTLFKLFTSNPRVKCVNTSAGAILKIPFFVAKGSQMSWAVAVEIFDIDVSLKLREQELGGAVEKILIEKQRVSVDKIYFDYEDTCDHDRHIILEFDNSYSKFRSKISGYDVQIGCCLDIASSKKELQDLMVIVENIEKKKSRASNCSGEVSSDQQGSEEFNSSRWFGALQSVVSAAHEATLFAGDILKERAIVVSGAVYDRGSELFESVLKESSAGPHNGGSSFNFDDELSNTEDSLVDLCSIDVSTSHDDSRANIDVSNAVGVPIEKQIHEMIVHDILD